LKNSLVSVTYVLTTKNLLEKNRLKSFKVIPINAIISICAYERNKSLKTKQGPV